MGAETGAGGYPATGGTNVATMPTQFQGLTKPGGQRVGGLQPLDGGIMDEKPPVKPWAQPGPANPADYDEQPVTGGWMPPRDAGGPGSIPPGTGGFRPPLGGGPTGIQNPVGLPTTWQGMGDGTKPGVKPWLNPGPANPADIEEFPTGGYMPPRDVPIQPMPSQPIYTVGGTRSDMAKPAVRPPMPTQGQGLTKPYAQPGPAQPAGGVGPYKPPQPDKPQFSTAQGMTKPAVRPPAYGKPGFGMKAPDPQTPPYAPYKKPETM